LTFESPPRSGEQARVTVNLVDLAEPPQLLRAEVINTTLSDPFKFQDQLATAVVEMLELELPPREEEALRAHGTAVARAYQLYLHGRGYLRSYEQPEKVDSAIAALQQALEIDQDYAQAHAALGMAYWKKYDHDNDPQWVDRASEACENSVELDQRLAEGHVCLGTVFKGTGSYGQAAAEFGWAISADPPLLDAFHGLGRTLESHGELDAAEEVFRKAIAQRPHYWATHNWLGAFYWRHGRYREAERIFMRVVEMAPLGYRGYQNLGGAYLLQGLYPDAIRTLEHSVSLKPHRHAYSNLATGYFGMRRFDQAVRFYEKAIEIGRRDYGIWGNLGEANFWVPDKPAAREAYRRAVELAREQLDVNPNDAEVLGELAKYHAMLGDRENALECLGRALEIGPSNPGIEFNAAVVYNQFAETRTAVEWLEKSRASGTSGFWIRDNPVFDNLRHDEKFQELIR
jgi:tetratricopeptide (TPR) repeat protein